MALSAKERESLPKICHDGKHEWWSLSAHACGAFSDDQVLSETVVLGMPTKGGLDATCNRCFLRWEAFQGIDGIPPDEINEILAIVYLERMSWEK